jgi:tetratricopeptide (TPR) repeat protein
MLPTIAQMQTDCREQPSNHQRAFQPARAILLRGAADAAYDYLRRAARAAPPQFAAICLSMMGRMLSESSIDEAVETYEQAVTLWPAIGEAWADLARLYWLRLNRPDLAAARLNAATRVVPEMRDVQVLTLQMLLTEEGAEAAETARRCFDEQGGRVLPEPDRLIVMASALEGSGRYDEALAWWSRLLAVEPMAVDALVGVARCHERLGDSERALREHEYASRLHPASPDALLGLNTCLMRLGAFDEAAERFRRFEADRPGGGPVPRWDGISVAGRSFSIGATVGHGDMIHFIRLVSVLRRLGARRIVVECMRSQRELFESMEGVDRSVIYYDEPVEADCRDSLQHMFHKMAHLIADEPLRAPYLSPSAARRTEWQGILREDDRFKVGLVWTSGAWANRDPYTAKNVPLSSLLSAGVPSGIRYYALQRGIGHDELRQPSSEVTEHSAGVIDVSAQACDLARTAAALVELDCLITVDTALAHLAGALDRPAVLLLPYHPDWRWGGATTSTRWYRSLRVVRQRRPGDWSAAIQEARQVVETLASTPRVRA